MWMMQEPTDSTILTIQEPPIDLQKTDLSLPVSERYAYASHPRSYQKQRCYYQ